MTFIPYILSKHSWQIILVLAIFPIIVILGMKYQDLHQSVSWFDPLAGLGTLLLAVFLWFNSIYREWENQLPKRLTVLYIFNGKPVMEAKNTVLTDLADARPWALQVGQQMSGGEQRLLFEPYFEFNANGILKDPITQKKYCSYTFKYILSELPKNFPIDTCRIWTPVYNQDGTLRSIIKDEIPLA